MKVWVNEKLVALDKLFTQSYLQQIIFNRDKQNNRALKYGSRENREHVLQRNLDISCYKITEDWCVSIPVFSTKRGYA